MIAEIVSVGSELLLGDIVNTNAAFLSKELAALGIPVYRQSVIGDNPKRLSDSLSEALSRSDIVITTGGLGPTCDDITKETAATLFSLPLVLDEASLASIKSFFNTVGRPMTENNVKQAMVPKGATVFKNNNGTAPGVAITSDNKTIIMLPGPPREIEPMFFESVKPFLESFSNQIFISHTVYLFGIGESAAEAKLRDLMDNSNPTVAPYAKDGETIIRITARGNSQQQADEMCKPIIDEIISRIGEYVYGIDVGSLQNALVKRLLDENLTVALAESCTGGLAAKRITEIPGSSKVFGCGIVSYSNEIKKNVLSVSEEILKNFGAVSPECATEMALGVLKISGADFALSVTGFAGPADENSDEPVGLVYICVTDGIKTDVKQLSLNRGYGNQRELIRYIASSHLLNIALKFRPNKKKQYMSNSY